jgi:integrase
MTALRQALDDYLAMRRALGYKLERAEKDLKKFITYLEGLGEEYVTIQSALTWATLPSGANRGYLSARLSFVRHFAIHLRAINPANEVPPTDLLPGRNPRATPYLYTREEVSALMRAAEALRSPYLQSTYRTLIGLLAATGLRIGEAIGIDCND